MVDPLAYPIDGVLDLHVFSPREARSVVKEYLRECRARGILRVRIIHGKGHSVLRGTVHRLFDAEPAVLDYHAAGDRSGWGATIVHLSPMESGL
jgi:DNA-nicking Smr family endonuclease